MRSSPSLAKQLLRRMPTVIAIVLLLGFFVWLFATRLTSPPAANRLANTDRSMRDSAGLDAGLSAPSSAATSLAKGDAYLRSIATPGPRDFIDPDARSTAFSAILKRLSQTQLALEQRYLLTRLFEVREEDATTFTAEGIVARAYITPDYIDFRDYLFDLSRARPELRMNQSTATAEVRAEYATAMLMAAEAIIRNPNLSLADASETLQRLWTDLLMLRQPLHNRLMSDLTMELIRANPGDRLSGNRDVWLRYRLDLIASSGDVVEFNRAVDEWASLDVDQRTSMQAWRFRARVTILAQNAPLEAIQRQANAVWSGLNGLSNQQIIDIGSDWIRGDARFSGDSRQTYREIARAFLPAIEQQIQRRSSQDPAELAPLITFRDQVQQQLAQP